MADAIGAVFELIIRVMALIVSIPFIFLWPRSNKHESYWAAAWRRSKKVFGFSLF
jgi:hypothetical protein